MLSELQYKVIPTFSADSGRTRELDKLYLTWKAFWSEILGDLGSSLALDDFSKCPYIGSIWRGDEIVSIHLYGLYDLGCACFRDQSYISSNFTENFLSQAKMQGFRTAVSFEYLSVMPNYQSNKELPIARITLGLAFEIYKSLKGVDIAIGITRDSKRVNEMVEDFGSEIVESGLVKNGEVSSLSMGLRSKLKRSASVNIQNAVNVLWANRVDARIQEQVLAA